jgi:hypothetical protein
MAVPRSSTTDGKSHYYFERGDSQVNLYIKEFISNFVVQITPILITKYNYLIRLGNAMGIDLQ